VSAPESTRGTRTAPTQESGMADPAPQVTPVRAATTAVADVVLTVLMLVLFGWAFLDAADWSFKAALFPRIVTGVGFVVSALHLVQALLRFRRDRAAAGAPVPATTPAGPIPPVAGDPVPQAAGTTTEDDVNEDDVEYVFQTAGARRWTEALAWVAGFFVLLYVAGLFITAPLFSFLYLRFAGRRSWLFSALYAVVLGAVLYLAFEVALGIPVPPGLFLD
jgi:Tripartite tricarboxylate transporter TctB family